VTTVERDIWADFDAGHGEIGIPRRRVAAWRARIAGDGR